MKRKRWVLAFTYLRADLEETILPEENATASGRHSVDVELGALDCNTSCRGFENMLKLASVAGNIGRSPAHVKAHYRSMAIVRGSCVANNTACGV